MRKAVHGLTYDLLIMPTLITLFVLWSFTAQRLSYGLLSAFNGNEPPSQALQGLGLFLQTIPAGIVAHAAIRLSGLPIGPALVVVPFPWILGAFLMAAGHSEGRLGLRYLRFMLIHEWYLWAMCAGFAIGAGLAALAGHRFRSWRSHDYPAKDSE